MAKNETKDKLISDINALAKKIVYLEREYMEDIDMRQLPDYILLDLRNAMSCLYLADENAAICYYKNISPSH